MGIIGSNGSGKSVLFKTICRGFVSPDKGATFIRGLKLGEKIDFPENVGVLLMSQGI